MTLLPTNLRHKAIGTSTVKCFQRVIREREFIRGTELQKATLWGCWVEEITPAEAKPIILKYEWLGTMGRSVHCYGLRYTDGELLGVVCFGWPGSNESRNICGKNHAPLAIALERGACVPHAPPNAASFLVSNACRMIATKGYRIVYAYADEDAGEIGTIYQACNWLYLGQGLGRSAGRLREYYRDPSGKVVSSRSLRHKRLTKNGVIACGWKVVYQKPKHKYVVFLGSHGEKRALRNALRYPPQPYPKRTAP